MQVLVTGATGYIGSHTVLELLNAGHSVVAVDNLSNSSAESLRRVQAIAGRPVPLLMIDLTSQAAVFELFAMYRFDAVIHFAGLKAVGESVGRPLHYYHNNLNSTLNLLAAMERSGVHKLVFSSSATVYGDPEEIPITESATLSATNPYGQTKLMIEQMLRDVSPTGPWQISLLRYFNPVGAHPSGAIGEDPNGIPNNLIPYIAQVAVGKLPHVRVFGNDYNTPDGTGVRDYIHVVDLARGHLAALENLPTESTCEAYNLGTGKGVSVLEAIQAFEKVSGKEIPYEIVDRRPGDIATCYADPTKANQELGWKATKSFEEAVTDSWRWQSQNPAGFQK